MCKCNKLINNLIIHSSSYIVILTSYAISVIELWDEETNGKLWKNIIRTIILLLPQIFAILEINSINVMLCFCSNQARLKMLIIKQEKLLSDLEEVNSTLNNSFLDFDKYEPFFNSYLEKFDTFNEYIKEIRNNNKQKAKKYKRRNGKGRGKNGKKIKN